MVELLFKELSELKEVEAIALGGSRAGENYDEKSDYDGELRLTFDNGLDSTTNQELVNLLEK